MRNPLRCLFVGVALTTAVTASAGAQTIPSSFRFLEKKQEAGPFVGVMSAQTGRFGFGPGGGLVLGGRFGVEMAGPLSFEGVLGFVRGTRDVVNPGRDEGDRVVGTSDVFLTTIDARLKFSFVGRRTWKGVNPFILFGGGMVFDTKGDSELDLDLAPADRFDFGSSFFGTVGTGARWFVSDGLTLRSDAVFSLWKIGTPPGFSDIERGIANVAESEWVRGLSLTLSAHIPW